MENGRNLNEIQERVNLYLDNELSKDAEKELLVEANSDQGVQNVLDSERHFREMLRTNVQRGQVSPDLIQSIRSKIKID